MTTFRFPPKSMFQFLCDPTVLEEFTRWRVVEPERFELGATWQEKKGLTRRTWTVTNFDRRGLSFTMEGQGVAVTLACKKGGPGSSNVQMTVGGPDKAVAKFMKSDGARLDRMKEWLES